MIGPSGEKAYLIGSMFCGNHFNGKKKMSTEQCLSNIKAIIYSKTKKNYKNYKIQTF